MLETRGAPRDQGIEQGRLLAASVRASAAALARQLGILAHHRARVRVRRAAGLAIARFLPQQHERLCGVALGARVRLADLELVELRSHAHVSAWLAQSGALEAVIDPGSKLVSRILRRSFPDAGGFPSAELTAAPWAGCLAGVNAEGVAAICAGDGDPEAVPVRLLAQDVLFRARTLGGAIDHLRRRAPYLACSGSLLLADSRGESRWAELFRGELVTTPAQRSMRESRAPLLSIDPVRRALCWTDAAGAVHTAAAEG